MFIKGFSKSGAQYYSIWFTVQIILEDTYDVGRYLDVEFKL